MYFLYFFFFKISNFPEGLRSNFQLAGQNTPSKFTNIIKNDEPNDEVKFTAILSREMSDRRSSFQFDSKICFFFILFVEEMFRFGPNLF